MKEIKNNLPKYWVVQLLEKEKELFRKTVTPYLKDVYGDFWGGNSVGAYYGYDGSSSYCGTNVWEKISTFENNPTVLTLQEFIELSKPIEEFKLPKDWVLKVTPKTVDVINKWKQTTEWKDHARQYDYVRYDGAGTVSGDVIEYSEITFEQFEKYVAKVATVETVKEDSFVLPERWCVEVTSVNDYKEYAEHMGYDLTHKWFRHTEGQKHYLYCDNKERATPKFVSLAYYSEYTRITLEQFQKHILAPIKNKSKEVTMYSIEEVKTNPKIIVYLDSEEEWDQLCEAVGFKIISKYRGKHCYSVFEKNWSESSSQTNVGAYDKDCIIITLKQIKINMDKKIVGYKFIKPEMYKAASTILYGNTAGSYALDNKAKSSFTGREIERLCEAGVLDLWFEPIYEEEEKFKVGDWVLTSNNANGWGSSVSEVNNKILKITKIDLEDLEFHGNRYYFGKEMTAGKEIVRLATPEEIEKAITKEFPIGDYKAVVKDGNIIIDGKGRISVEAFNTFYEGWLQDDLGTTVNDYEVSLTVATIKIGCVRNVTLEQARELYNYTKTL